MRRTLLLGFWLSAALPTIALGQITATAAGPVTITSGSTAKGLIRVKNQGTTTYTGGWEFFQTLSPGFERVGNPEFTCDPRFTCSVTTPNCMQFPEEKYACFAQTTLAPGGTINEVQVIKQQPGGAATGTWTVELGNDIGTIFLTIPISVAAAACPTITISPDTLPQLTVDVQIDHESTNQFSIAATGGSPPYRFDFTGLPDGVGFNRVLSALEGTPRTDGTFNVTGTVTDSTPSPPGPCTATRSYTVKVNAAPGQPKWEITKTHESLGLVDINKPFDVTYTVTIKNVGTAVAHGFLFEEYPSDSTSRVQKDPSPCIVQFTSSSPGSVIGSCRSSEDVAPQQSKQFIFVMSYTPPYKRDVENFAQVSGGGAPIVAPVKDVIRVGNLDRFLSPQPPGNLAPNKGRRRGQ